MTLLLLQQTLDRQRHLVSLSKDFTKESSLSTNEILVSGSSTDFLDIFTDCYWWQWQNEQTWSDGQLGWSRGMLEDAVSRIFRRKLAAYPHHLWHHGAYKDCQNSAQGVSKSCYWYDWGRRILGHHGTPSCNRLRQWWTGSKHCRMWSKYTLPRKRYVLICRAFAFATLITQCFRNILLAKGSTARETHEGDQLSGSGLSWGNCLGMVSLSG